VIDRKTALACSALIALMLGLAVWRILTLDHLTTLAVHDGAPLPALLLFVFPACSALVVGALGWTGLFVRTDAAKLRPWHRWGKFLSISYCVGMLLLQGVVIVGSLGLDMPLDLSALARSLGLLMALMALLAINQMPKLPWFERRFQPGGNLGPIYGPRYMRTLSKVTVAFMIATIAYGFIVPQTTGWRSAAYILVATALLVVWSIAWRWHLGRKWKIEQLGGPGAKP